MTQQEWLYLSICFILAVASAAGAAAFGSSRAAQQHYAKREDIDRAKIAQLEHEVTQLKGQVAMLMGMISPKADAVAP